MQFTRNTSSAKRAVSLIIKLGLVLLLFLGVIFLLSKIDFPTPKKEVEKIIPNENFKIVK
jgi:flagellar biogenesis protein FliO